MKNVLVACLLCGVFAVGYSQEKENIEMNPAQFSVNHAYRVYQAALSLNDLESAKGALLDILVEIPQNDSILFNLAQIYFELQNYSGAAACASQVIKSSPNNFIVAS